MPTDLISRLQKGAVLCDGAMGTLLYSKGIFINRCYDELNVSQPDLIRAVHQEYLQAGADIIETNTFGANSFRLAKHGCVDKLADINRQGARVAREAAKSFDALVAGAVGPLGVRIEPLGKLSLDETRAAFRQQISALNEEGIDLIILETFGYLEELHQAILAAREVNPALPVIAQVTIDEDGNCLDGSSPDHYGPQMEEWGADVIGCNCSVGPVAMLDALERVRAVTSSPLSAQPNAGMPRSVEGRNIYLCSPEYMASYTKKFINVGVRLVGGCCGTTPEHIHSMKSAMRIGDARTASYKPVAVPKAHPVQVAPLKERSQLGRKIADGEFVTMVEIVPPKGPTPPKK
jgi:homocysteine S-methyltransferase